MAVPGRKIITRPNCRAKNPSKCPFHGKKARAYEAERLKTRLIEERKQKEKADKLKLHVEHDIEANMKPKMLPTGETIVSVFRSGIINPPKVRGTEGPSYANTDKYAPEGRQGRYTGVFASPTLGASARWVKGNASIRGYGDINVRELRVDYDKTYVYSVREWERCSSKMYNDDTPEEVIKEAAEKYWATGITLREWVQKFKENPLEYDPREWELLLNAEEDIKAIKPVSGQRVATFEYTKYESDRKETLKLLKKPKQQK